MTNKATALITDLLAGLTATEAKQLIDAEAQRQAAEQERQAQQRAALLQDAEAQRRAAERERAQRAEQLHRERAQAEQRATAARSAFDKARTDLLTAAAEVNQAVEQHRRLNDQLGAVAIRPVGEMWPWERPTVRWSPRDAVELIALERAR
jgi:hypothetical protein